MPDGVKLLLPLLLLAASTAIGCGSREEKRASPPAPKTTSPTPKPLEGGRTAAPKVEPVARDLTEIRGERDLRVIFTWNSTGYFIFRGDAMGFEYELLSRFAKANGLHLKPVLAKDSATLFDLLNRGEGDVVAAQLVAPANESEVLVTNGLYATSPVVVQKSGDITRGRSPAVAKALKREERETGIPAEIEIRARLISTPAELAGKPVHVARSSPYRPRLLELNQELSDDIEVVEVDESTDKLIQRLAEGEIVFTVAAENLAALKQAEYTNIVIKPALGEPQQVVWAVRRTSPQLHDALNTWLAAKSSQQLRAVLYRKYFLDRRRFVSRASSRYLTSETGTLSPYDDMFREYARIPGWDWRLVASQAFQESRFNPNARSWAGAAGLMQIMPRTARELRVNPHDPRQSVEGACRYLWKLDDYWKNVIPAEKERIKFILGAYNVGLGHVQDARRLAEKHGDDPASWEDVGYWLIRKSKRNVYNDPVVKYGFARGVEPVTYVESILDRFEHYKAFVKAE